MLAVDWGHTWSEFWRSPFWLGVLGGVALAIVGLVQVLKDFQKEQVSRDTSQKLNKGFIGGWTVGAVLVALFGGIIGKATEGSAGAFITGITALGFVALIARGNNKP
jgi:hypothetical protein